MEQPHDMIVYKERDGLSTYYAKHKRDLPPPNFPLPAIRMEVHVIPPTATNTARNSISVWEFINCPCCNEENKLLCCVWDFDPMRAFNFGIKPGEYAHHHRLEEGVELWEQTQDLMSGTVQ